MKNQHPAISHAFLFFSGVTITLIRETSYLHYTLNTYFTPLCDLELERFTPLLIQSTIKNHVKNSEITYCSFSIKVIQSNHQNITLKTPKLFQNHTAKLKLFVFIFTVRLNPFRFQSNRKIVISAHHVLP